MTLLVHDPREAHRLAEEARRSGKRVAFVPTMGALHEGHLTLVDEARRRAEFCVVSVFVNPMQFGPKDDFARYPRTLDADVEGCRVRGVDVVYAPDRDAMYPKGFATQVDVEGLTSALEGVHRPGHFRGVATVVAKLFATIGACDAIFGRKDYQQWKVLERMTRDLGLPVNVVGMKTVRESDGLAMSSRNRYLDVAQRARALGIVTGLRAAWSAFERGEREVGEIERVARAPIDAAFDHVDYVTVADADELVPLAGVVGERALIAVAAKIGTTRLIDNVVLGEDPFP